MSAMPRHAYRTMSNWLKPNGCLTHQIDFKYHGLAKRAGMVTGATPDFSGKGVQGGRRTYLLNREHISKHIQSAPPISFQGYLLILLQFQTSEVSTRALGSTAGTSLMTT